MACDVSIHTPPFGNVDPNYAGGNIVLALGNNTTGGVLGGTTSEAAVAGVASSAFDTSDFV